MRHAPYGIFVADEKGRYLEVNQAGAEMTGYSPGELVTMGIPDLVFPDAAQGAMEDLTRLGHGDDASAAYPLQRKDGERRLARVKAVKLAENRYMAFAEDVTEQAEMEDRLRASQERFRLLVESAPEGVFVQTRYRFAYLNRKAVQLFGAKGPEDLMGASVLERFDPGLHESIRERIRLLNEEKAAVSRMEQVYFRLDGRPFDVEVSAVPITWEGENGALVFFRDITERKKLKQDLERIFSLSLDMICILDLGGQRFAKVNPAFTRILGWSEEELLSRPIYEFIHPEDVESTKRVTEESLRRGESVLHFENRYRCKDGGIRWIRWVSHPVVEDGVAYAVGGDVTDRKQFEQSLMEAKEAAEAANLTKSEFLANMSHELRTPLNGVMGMLQVLRMSSEDPEHQDYVDKAIEASRRLSRLLGDILDISRIDAGKLDIEAEPFDPVESLESAVELLRDAAEEKGLALEVRLDPSIPRRLVGDAVRLQQVVINLLGNAVKFTEQGRVWCEAGALPAYRPGTFPLLLVVGDTGMGMEEESVPELFNSFTQAESSYTRRFQGAGLGLSIVRRLLELMGGSLCVSTALGEGSEFYVRIALTAPEEPPGEDSPDQEG